MAISPMNDPHVHIQVTGTRERSIGPSRYAEVVSILLQKEDADIDEVVAMLLQAGFIYSAGPDRDADA